VMFGYVYVHFVFEFPSAGEINTPKRGQIVPNCILL
jgi:hypothetical protein